MAVGDGTEDGDGDQGELTEHDLELEIVEEVEIRCGVSLYGPDES